MVGGPEIRALKITETIIYNLKITKNMRLQIEMCTQQQFGSI